MNMYFVFLPQTFVERGEGFWTLEEWKSVWAPPPMFQILELEGTLETGAGYLARGINIHEFHYTNPYTAVSFRLAEEWTTYDVYEDPDSDLIHISPPPHPQSDKPKDREKTSQESNKDKNSSKIIHVIHNPIITIWVGLRLFPRRDPNRIEILDIDVEFPAMHFVWETAFVLAELAYRLQGCISIGEEATLYATFIFHPPDPDAPEEKSTLAHLVRETPFSLQNFEYRLKSSLPDPHLQTIVCPSPHESVTEMARRLLSHFAHVRNVEWPTEGNWENTHQTPFDRYSLWWRYMFRYPQSARHNIPERYHPLLVEPVHRVDKGRRVWDQPTYFLALWETNYERVFIPAWVHYVAFTPPHEINMINEYWPILQCDIPPFAYDVHELIQALGPKASRIQGGWLCERDRGETEGWYTLNNLTLIPVQSIGGKAIHRVAP